MSNIVITLMNFNTIKDRLDSRRIKVRLDVGHHAVGFLVGKLMVSLSLIDNEITVIVALDEVIYHRTFSMKEIQGGNGGQDGKNPA